MISFERQGWADYVYWQTTDKSKLKRINQLIRDIERDPFEGIGKPEPTAWLGGIVVAPHR